MPPRPLLIGSLLFSGVTALAVQAQSPRPDPREFQSRVRPVLAASCLGCHNATRQVGGVDLSTVGEPATAYRQRRLWRRVAAQVEAGTMPPKGSKELSTADRAALLNWTRLAADYLDPQDPANRDPGPSVLRRLTVTEYNRTVKDLLGIDYDANQEVGLSDADVPNGYDNLAAALTLSPALLDKYLLSAEKILDRVFKDRRTRDVLLTPRPENGLSDREAARQLLQRVARRAYRRPLREVDLERLLKVYDRGVAEAGTGGIPGVTGPFETGVRAALKPVLISPYFLFRVEANQPLAQPTHVSDYELAARLSYFLWSTLPDETLSALADQGRLSDSAVLDEQVRRMLKDPKARMLTESFARQWLQLDKLNTARPSTEFFPAFNGRLRRAMYEETTTFFDQLRLEDRSVLDLLDSDYTYVNADLAKHYGIPGVEGDQVRRVELKPEYHRGGLLGMGSVLAMTSHTFRTSPTLRGKYVLEVLLGTPPPPPPPNAAGMLKEERGKEPKSFREQLAQHAGNPSCSGCHRKLDPLGFAMDNFDAVGAWRESTPEKPLDTTGELPTGEKFNSVSGLKQVVLKRKDQYLRNLTGQLLSYSLGRELQDSDDWTLRQVATDTAKGGYRLSTLISGIVKSVPFQYRRGGKQ
jgi:mono/diheme cytochrome c family protein